MGTLLNDAPITSARLLNDGDVLSICGRCFRFEYDMSGDFAPTVAMPAAAPRPAKVGSAKKSPRAPSSAAKKENESAANVPPAAAFNPLAAVATAAAAAAASRAELTARAAEAAPAAGGRTPLVDKDCLLYTSPSPRDS